MRYASDELAAISAIERMAQQRAILEAIRDWKGLDHRRRGIAYHLAMLPIGTTVQVAAESLDISCGDLLALIRGGPFDTDRPAFPGSPINATISLMRRAQ